MERLPEYNVGMSAVIQKKIEEGGHYGKDE